MLCRDCQALMNRGICTMNIYCVKVRRSMQDIQEAKLTNPLKPLKLEGMGCPEEKI